MSDARRICVCGKERGKEPVIITITTCKKNHGVKTEGGPVCVSPPTNEPLSEVAKNTKPPTGDSSKAIKHQPVVKTLQPLEGQAIYQQDPKSLKKEEQTGFDPNKETGEQPEVRDGNEPSPKIEPQQKSTDAQEGEDVAKDAATESDLQSVRSESEIAEVPEDEESIQHTVEEALLESDANKSASAETVGEQMHEDGSNELTTSSRTVGETDNKSDDQPVSTKSETQTTENAQLIIPRTDVETGNKPVAEPPVTDTDSNENDEETENEPSETDNAAKPHKVENEQLEEDGSQETHEYEKSKLSAASDEKQYSSALESREDEKHIENVEDDKSKKSSQTLIQVEQPGTGGVETTSIEPDEQPIEENENQSIDSSSPSEKVQPTKEQNNEPDSNIEEITDNANLNNDNKSSAESENPQQETETENSNKEAEIESSANELATSSAQAINTTQDLDSSLETEMINTEEFPKDTENPEPVLAESMLPAESSSIKILKNASARYLDEENDDYQSAEPLDAESPEEKLAKLSNEPMKQSDTSKEIEENQSNQANEQVDAKISEINENIQNASVEPDIADQESNVINAQSLDTNENEAPDNDEQIEPSNIEESQTKILESNVALESDLSATSESGFLDGSKVKQSVSLEVEEKSAEMLEKVGIADVEKLETNIIESNNALESDLPADLESGSNDGSKIKQPGSLDDEDNSTENLTDVKTIVGSSADNAVEDTANITDVEDSSVDRQQESETLQNAENETDAKRTSENGSSTSKHDSSDTVNKNNPAIIMRTETAMNTVMPKFDRLFWDIISPISKSRRLMETANNEGTATISAEEKVKNLQDMLRAIAPYSDNQQIGQYLHEQDILNVEKYTSMANYKDTCEQTSSSHMGEMSSQIITSDQGLQVGTSYIFNRKNSKWYKGFLICFGLKATDSLYDIGNLSDDLIVGTKSSYIVTKYLRI